jgi:hypothetical protein
MHREQSVPFWIKPAAVISLIAGLCGIAGTRQARTFMEPVTGRLSISSCRLGG